MKRRMRRRGSPRRRATVLAGLLIALILLAQNSIRASVERVAAYQVRVFSARLLNDAILTELEREGVGYGDIVRLSLNNNGDVTSLQTDMAEINRLKAQITAAMLERLEGMGVATLRVPLGTLIGNEFTSGRGPMVEIKVYPAGYLQTDIYSQFTGAGINQTLHQVMVSAGVRMTAVMPGYKINCETDTGYCIAQTVIVGGIPDSYTQINGDGAPLISKINDYSER